jgi:hypothetical protein
MWHFAKHWTEGTQTNGQNMTKDHDGKGVEPLPKSQGESLEVERREGETDGTTLARVTLDPLARHAILAGSFGNEVFGDSRRFDVGDSATVLSDEINRAAKGDLSMASRMLLSQAFSLDAMFTELVRRSGNNMGKFPDAMDRYMRLALKAQSSCRATLEALARLHQPREQTVKHVHVNEGGQAVVADQFHHHAGGSENRKSIKQSDATSAAGGGAALFSPDPLRDGVPISSCEGKAALSYARGDKSGSA